MSKELHQSKVIDLIAIFTAKPGKAEKVCPANGKYLGKTH